MAKPKLALIPAAQGTKFYSVLPSDGSGDFTFTRGSVATRINAQGLIENVASGQSRLNYPLIDGVQKGCPHHILEPQRTNLLPYSNDFSQWTSDTNATIASNNAISPDGTLNADKLIAGSSVARQAIKLNVSLSGEISLSVFAKKGEYSVIQFTDALNGSYFINFDLQTGTIGSSNTMQGKIENIGNDWYRCSASYNSSNAILSFRLSISKSRNSARLDPTFAGNSSDGLYIYGAQVEQGSYPTSYIPTNGESGGVTRSAETATGAGNSTTFNDSEGVFMAELLWTATSSNIYISIDDNTSNNRILIYSNSTDDIKALVGSGGFTQAAFTATNQDPTTFNKVAVKYKQNDFALWINGIKLLTDTLGSTPIGLSNLGFRAGGGTNPLHGSAKQIQYYDSSLTDSELEQLTSWTSFSDMANGQLYTIE